MKKSFQPLIWMLIILTGISCKKAGQVIGIEGTNEVDSLLISSYSKKAEEAGLFSQDWISPIDWFYLGISNFELRDYKRAIENFDIALKQYPTFGDAQFYKYKCLNKLDKKTEAQAVLNQAFKNIILGNTINEANSIYEKYTYQVYKQEVEYLAGK